MRMCILVEASENRTSLRTSFLPKFTVGAASY